MHLQSYTFYTVQIKYYLPGLFPQSYLSSIFVADLRDNDVVLYYHYTYVDMLILNISKDVTWNLCYNGECLGHKSRFTFKKTC